MGSVYCVICFLPTSLVVHLLETERLALTLFFFPIAVWKGLQV